MYNIIKINSIGHNLCIYTNIIHKLTQKLRIFEGDMCNEVRYWFMNGRRLYH